MTNHLTVHTTYSREQITTAQKDAFARAVHAARIHAALNQSNVLSAGEFGTILSRCIRHAAKAQDLRTRDLWAVMPEDVAERVENAAGVYIYCV